MLSQIDGDPRAVSGLKTDALTLLTFNAGLMQYKLLGVTLIRNPPFTNRRLRHMPIALRAANADIVALQEIFEERQADFLIESLRLIYPFSARRMSGGVLALHNGLLTLSKFPIVRTDFYKFQNITWSESLLGSKGVLETVVNVPSVGLICALNVHMVSGSLDPESARLDCLRAEETRELLNLAAAAETRGEIPVLLGDFNAAPTICPASYNMLLQERWDDAFLLATPESHLLSLSQPLKSPCVCMPPFAAETSSMYSEAPGGQRPPMSRGKIRYTRVSLPEERLADDCSTCDSVEDAISGRLDASDRRIWTWDPTNALNLLGPHANCHGLRCDHVFLPPLELRGGLASFGVVRSQILFYQPRVLIQSKWLRTCLIAPLSKCLSRRRSSPDTAPLLVTLSDHYAVRVELSRTTSRISVDACSRRDGDAETATTAVPSSTHEVCSCDTPSAGSVAVAVSGERLDVAVSVSGERFDDTPHASADAAGLGLGDGL